MALFGAIQGSSEGKKIVHGTVLPTAAVTTISSQLKAIDAVIISFVSAPTSAHYNNYYSTSTNGNVFITHQEIAVAGSAVAITTAASSFSTLAYMIIGDER